MLCPRFEDEFLDAWEAIPNALENITFAKDKEQIFLFDPKQKKWFVEGVEYLSEL